MDSNITDDITSVSSQPPSNFVNTTASSFHIPPNIHSSTYHSSSRGISPKFPPYNPNEEFVRHKSSLNIPRYDSSVVRLGSNMTRQQGNNTLDFSLSSIDDSYNYTSATDTMKDSSNNQTKHRSMISNSNNYEGKNRMTDIMTQRPLENSGKLGNNNINGANSCSFWFEDPTALFQTLELIPNARMSDAERLNAMTRVIIIIAAIMFVVRFPAWWMFLVIGIIVVIILWYIIKGREQSYNEQIRQRFSREYLRKPTGGQRKRTIIQPITRPARVSLMKNFNNNQKQIMQDQPLKIISIP